MSRKSASLGLVSISGVTAISLNTLMMFFQTFSVFRLLRFLNKASSPSQYNPKIDFGSIFSIFTEM